jgi:GTPase
VKRAPQEQFGRPELAVLFGTAEGRGRERDGAPLAELAGLAEAADVAVAARVVQRLVRPVAATYVGSGKVEELKEIVARTGADLAIADVDLSPAQARNLTLALGVRVVDRSELIMDIFARRARTSQAQLQVELAQLQYALPRLRGQWSHLDRYRGGGVGTRGPGEKQIETDRRLVQRRIQDLQDKLALLEQRTRLQMAGRAGLRSVALAGYTNTGKSTLFNALTGADVPAANRLFATLDTRTRRWSLDASGDVLLSDTVGFVRDLPHHLVASFHATLEEVVEADLVLHVVDATDPDSADRIDAVNAVLRQIGAADVPSLMVLNKVDHVRDGMQLQALLNRERGAVPVSARTGQGLDVLAARVRERLDGGARRFRLVVPMADGRLMAQLRDLAQVLESRSTDDAVDFRVATHPRQVSRLRAWAESNGLQLISGDGPEGAANGHAPAQRKRST